MCCFDDDSAMLDQGFSDGESCRSLLDCPVGVDDPLLFSNGAGALDRVPCWTESGDGTLLVASYESYE